MSPYQKQVKDIVMRTLVFFGLLSVAIGVCVNWLIEKDVFISGGFLIYGNKGKLIILLAILFPFIIHNRIDKLPQHAWNTSSLVYGAGLLATCASFFLFSSQLSPIASHNLLNTYLAAHISLLLIPLFLALLIFGHRFLISFVKNFRKELLLLFIIGIMLYIGVGWVWNLWPIFSGVVLQTVSTVFSLTHPTTVVLPDVLTVSTFTVRVGEECSGLESLFMFSTLYALIGYFDRKKLNTFKYLLAFVPLALGLYLVNILRVYLLVLVGVLWSPELAITLFHTYLGMVLFVVYFFIFLKTIYPKLKGK